MASCSERQRGSHYHFDLEEPTRPVFYWIPDEQEKLQVQTSGWDTLISLFVVRDGKPVSTSVSLKAALRHDTCFITPVVPLGRHMSFEWQVCLGNDTVKKRFQTQGPTTSGAATCRVISAYPKKDSIPSNILLFHLIFSRPMREDPQAYDHVHIVDESGREMPFTWRQKASWSDSGRHLTLMIHPGRVKTGINYASETGPLFRPGKYYTLKTDEALLSLDALVAQPYSKTYYIQEADRISPRFKPFDMKCQPAANSSEPLYIAFTEAMDYGAAEIGLTVKDQAGRLVAGRFQYVHDSLWLFIPDATWKAHVYKLFHNEYLVDLASNHTNRLFEMKSIEHMRSDAQVEFSFIPR